MSKRGGARMSTALVLACARNNQEQSALQRVLGSLDRQRTHQLHVITRDMARLERTARDTSPSPRSAATTTAAAPNGHGKFSDPLCSPDRALNRSPSPRFKTMTTTAVATAATSRGPRGSSDPLCSPDRTLNRSPSPSAAIITRERSASPLLRRRRRRSSSNLYSDFRSPHKGFSNPPTRRFSSPDKTPPVLSNPGGAGSSSIDAVRPGSSSSNTKRKDTGLSPASPVPLLLPQRRRPVSSSSIAASSVSSRRRSSLPGPVEVTVVDLKNEVWNPAGDLSVVSRQRLSRSESSSPEQPPLLQRQVQTLSISSVPQIVISDDPVVGEHVNPTGWKREESSPGACGGSGFPPFSGSDFADSDRESSPPEPLASSSSLHLPHRRLRSNSMPQIQFPALPGLLSLRSPRPSSSCQTPDLDSSDLDLQEVTRRGCSPRRRDRSASFSGGGGGRGGGIFPHPVSRRGSIPERWGSISERERPGTGGSHGRRGSADMDRMLRDLRYGILNREMLRAALDSPPAAFFSQRLLKQQQWEELKDCRYLRIPCRPPASDEHTSD